MSEESMRHPRPPGVDEAEEEADKKHSEYDVEILYKHFQDKIIASATDPTSTELLGNPLPFQTTNPFIQVASPREVQIFPQSDDGSAFYGTLFQTQINWQVESDFPDLFNNTTVRLKYTLNTNSIVCTIQYDPTGRLIAFADGRTIFLLDSRDGSLSSTIPLPQTMKQMDMQTRALKFTPDSMYIVVNCPNNTIEVFSVVSGESVAILEGHEDLVSALAFTGDGQFLISGGFDGNICIWDMATFSLVRRISHRTGVSDGRRCKDSIITAIEVGCENQYVAIAFMNGMVGIYDPLFAHPMSSFAAHQQPLLNMVTSKRSRTIVTASQDKTIRCWNIGGVANCSRTFQGHVNFAVTTRLCINEKYVLSGSKDETIKLWNRETGALQCTVYAHQNTIFELDHHPSERAFVTCGGDGYVCYWEYDLPE